MVVTPPVLAVDLKRNFPDIESAIRLMGTGEDLVRAGNQNFIERNNITYADEDFFKVFNFPLVIGDPATVLSTHGSVVITERLANKYFGKENPIGKVITFPNEKNLNFTVGGVAKNFPANSSLQYDMIIPMKSDPDYNERIAEGLNTSSQVLILKLKAGTNLARFRKKLDDFSVKYFKRESEQTQSMDTKSKAPDTHLYLRSFADAHYNQSGSWGHYTDLKNIYQLICLTAVILFIACLNYILLTLTGTISRSQDVGIRKTIGASRRQVIWQYYIETQLLAIISVIAGLLVSVVCLPAFNTLTGASLGLEYFSFGEICVLLLVLAAFLGLSAGIYPALAMSGLRPLNMLRSFSAFKLSPVLSKSLVVVQFTICVILVISSLAMNKQISYVSAASLGFDKDEVLTLTSPYSWSDKDKATVLGKELAHYAATTTSLQDMTSTQFTYSGGDRNGYLINGEKTMLRSLRIDYNYFSFFKIPIVKGRAFLPDIVSDSATMQLPELRKNQKSSLAFRSVVVNETLYKMLGKPRLNILNPSMGGVIIGVCKDYHTDDLTQKIPPVYHTINTRAPSVYWLKIRPGKNIPDVMKNLKATWNSLTGNLPFEYTFLDDEVAKGYDAYQRWMTTINASCILAIIIACLGLFGLSGLNAINRTKEIGIRKVLGASVKNLFLLLNKGTIFIALGSFVIAAPIAYYLVRQWLNNFAYHIALSWELFIAAGIIALTAAFAAVSYHTIRAAIANPVKSLRNE